MNVETLSLELAGLPPLAPNVGREICTFNNLLESLLFQENETESANQTGNFKIFLFFQQLSS